MTNRSTSLTTFGCVVALVLFVGRPTMSAGQESATPALRLVSSQVSLAGTSNIHAYTASTRAARLTRLQLSGSTAGAAWDDVLKPGAIEAFEIAVPAATLSSAKDGLDKNMHKALKVTEHADITFRLLRLETGAAEAIRAVGVLRIAGVDREVALDLKAVRTATTLTVTGAFDLLMTDFGITPPKAMLGMLKTDPKVTVTVETVFSLPLT